MTHIQKSGGFGTSVETRYESQHKARAIDDICFIFYAAAKGQDYSNAPKNPLNDMPTNDAEELAFRETDYIIEQAFNYLADLDNLKALKDLKISSPLDLYAPAADFVKDKATVKSGAVIKKRVLELKR